METAHLSLRAPQLQDSQATQPQQDQQTGGKRGRLGNFRSLGLQSCPECKGTVGAHAEQHGPIYSEVSRPQHRLLTYAGVRSIYSQLPSRLAPTRCAPALSAADISRVRIGGDAARGCVSGAACQRLPHPPKSPSQRGLEESSEGSEGQKSKGSLPTPAWSVEKTGCEQVKGNLKYGGLLSVGRKEQSRRFPLHGKALRAARTTRDSLCPTAAPTRST